MFCLTEKECCEWLLSHDIDAVDARGFPEVVGDYEVLFAAPTQAARQRILAKSLVQWIGPYNVALFWLSEWTAYEEEEMALACALRRGHGEKRMLIDAPGHVFSFEEQAELIGWVFLMINFGWDGYLFASPHEGRMFQTSHENFLWATSQDYAALQKVRQVSRLYNLEVYRETEFNQKPPRRGESI
jgi:hypothetical protein